MNDNNKRLLRYVRENVNKLAEACFLASEWQVSCWDAHRKSDAALAASYYKSAIRYRRMEKKLRLLGRNK